MKNSAQGGFWGKLPPSFLHCSAILFLTEMARSAFLISFLPAYANDRHITLAAVGAAVSIHYLADTLIKVVAGYVLDRFPARLILNAFLLLGLLGLFVSFGISAPWAIIAGSGLLGIGVSPIWLLCLSEIREDRRGSQMGAVYTVWLVSLGLGPVAVNFLIDRSYSLSFWLLAGLWAGGWALAAVKSSVFRSRDLIRTVPFKQQLRQMQQKLSQIKPLVPGMICRRWPPDCWCPCCRASLPNIWL
ncbi:hypothetical protein HMSSN036_38470 [Paenibacillus macerans]|nr:hypothetical protein HMSSN036_38470 [Paenibacillus macerans]